MMALVHLVVLLFVAGYKPVTATLTGDRNISCDFKDGDMRQTIYFAYMTTFSGSFVSSGTIPAVDLALERINNDSSLLKNYNLTYTEPIDTKCDRSSSLDAFFNMVQSVPPYPLAILGMGCAVATEPVAELNNNWRLPMMGYVAAAPSLSDRELYKSYYRTYPSDANFVPTLISYIDFYKWKKLLMITENAITFISNDRLLKNILAAKGVDVSPESFTFIIEESDSAVEQMVERIVTDRNTDDPHVIFINTFEAKARVIICKFYRLGLTTRDYMFITHGWYQTGWWSESVSQSQINCTDDDMIQMLEGMIAVHQFPLARNNSMPTISGLSVNEFDQIYRNKLKDYPNLKYQFEATCAFDAVWALALAMDNASQSLCTGDIGYCSNSRVDDSVALENYTFYNDRIECLLNRSLSHLQFEGVSGYVQFDENGTRIQNDVYIQQYRKNSTSNSLIRVSFGIIQPQDNNSFSYVNGETSLSVWPDGIPHDGTPIKIFNGVHIVVTVILNIFAITGIIFAIVCLVFNIAFKKRKIVKLTSPLLNYFTVVGAIMLYLSVIASTLPGISDIINGIKCYAGSVLFAIGYTVAFSAVLTKIFRVYYIFRNPAIGKKVLKDWYLVLLAFAIVAVTIVLIVIENSVSEIRPNPTEVPDRERGRTINERDIIVLYCVYSCGGLQVTRKIFQIVVLVYLLLLQIIGIVLAFQTRKVKVKVLNDAKWIAAMIYSSSLCVIVIILSKFTLTGLLNTETALANIVILVATTIFLALAFVPKMVNLYKDPKGEKVFQNSSNGTAFNASRRSTINIERKLSRAVFGFFDDNQHDELKQKVTELEEKNKELEAKLMECKCKDKKPDEEKLLVCKCNKDKLIECNKPHEDNASHTSC